MVLNCMLLLMQLCVLYRVLSSPLWASRRQATEGAKVIFVSIALASIATGGVAVAAITGWLDFSIPPIVRAGMFSLLLTHSLTAYHVVQYLDKKRIENRQHATSRPATH